MNCVHEFATLDPERLREAYEAHEPPDGANDWVAHVRGRCHTECWERVVREYNRRLAADYGEPT